MAKIAKITLTAEVGQFKQRVEEAKKSLEGLGAAKISPTLSKDFAKHIKQNLDQTQKDVEAKIRGIEGRLKQISKGGDAAWDAKKVGNYITLLGQLKQRLKDVEAMQGQIGKGKFPEPASQQGGAGMGDMVKGGMGRLLAPLLGAFGVMAMFHRRFQMAEERMKVRSLTRDGASVAETSQYGFTPAERRQRAAQLAQSAGGVTGGELTKMTDMGELVERAYGIGGETSSGFMGAARKSGVGGAGAQTKLLASAIGAAIKAGLDGSKTSEYISAMTGFMEQMSQGVNIDHDSLNGFAAAMGSLPFFKDDPRRIFSALGGMDQAFKNGDPFQRALATRGILGAAPGASPAATEFRRSMGLFGNNLSPETMKQLKAAGVDTRVMGVSGGQILQNQMNDVMGSTKGLDANSRLYMFAERMGLQDNPAAAATLFGQYTDAEKSGKSLDWDKMGKEYSKATMSPQERLDKTMGTVDGDVLKLKSSIDRLIEVITDNLTQPLTDIANALVKAGGGVDRAGEMGAGAVVGGAAAYGASKVGKFAAGKGAGLGAMGITKAAGKGAKAVGAKGAASMIGKYGARAIPIVKNLVSVGFALSDAWDIGGKIASGQKVNWEEWGALGMDVAAIFDPTWFALAGSVGMEGVKAARESGMVGDTSIKSDFTGGMPTPSGQLPDVGPDGQLSSSMSFQPPAQSSSIFGASTDANTQATMENTAAMRELSVIMGRGRGGGGARVPSYSGDATAFGKGGTN